MNFLAVRNTKENDYVEFTATLHCIVKNETTSKGKPKVSAIVVDGAGESQEVAFFNFNPIAQFVGQQVPVKICWDNWKGRGLKYKGYVQDRDLTQPAHPTPMQAPPQARVPMPPLGPTQPQGPTEQHRSFACGNAARIVATMGIVDINAAAQATISIANQLADWIAKGDEQDDEVPI